MLKKYLALFLCSFVFASHAFAQDESTPQIRQKTFEKIWRTINEKFYDANFGGVDWRKIHNAYAPQVAQTKTNEEFYELLNKMLGELKTSHLQIIPAELVVKTKSPATDLGFGVREIENRVVITRVTDDSAAKAGLKPGYIITKVNGAAVENLADARIKLSILPDGIVRVEYLDANDAERETTFRPQTISADDGENLGGGLHLYAAFASRRVSDDIGYISFTSFLTFLNPRIKGAIESFKDTKGIIIDLRGNGGGDDSVALKMANQLFDKETQLMITKTRKGEDNYYKVKGSRDAYRGKIVVLLDEFSASASEQLAAGLQESKRAYVIGKRSAGADLDARLIKLPDGSALIYAFGQPRTPKGIVIEGRGVAPDKEVNLTRESLLAGHDAQLEAAIEYIKK